MEHPFPAEATLPLPTWLFFHREGLSLNPQSPTYTLIPTTYDHPLATLWDFPGGASGKELACQCRRRKRHRFSIPGSGRSPAGRNSNPLQYSHLENPMDKRAWQAIVHRVVELDTTEVI